MPRFAARHPPGRDDLGVLAEEGLQSADRRDRGRGARLALALDLVDVKVAAVDAVWSGLKLVIRKERRAAHAA